MVTANYPYKRSSSLQTKTNTVKYDMWQLFSSWLILILLAHKLCCTYDKNYSLCSEKKMIIYEQFFCFVSKYATGRKIGMIRYMYVIFREFSILWILDIQILFLLKYVRYCREKRGEKELKYSEFEDNMKGTVLYKNFDI